MCKSWAVYVPIAQSYDQNKLTLLPSLKMHYISTYTLAKSNHDITYFFSITPWASIMSLGAQNRAKSGPRAVDFDVKSCKSTDLREKIVVFFQVHMTMLVIGAHRLRGGCCQQVLVVLLHIFCNGVHARQ